MAEMDKVLPSERIQLCEHPTPRDIAEFMVRVLDAKRAQDIKLLYVENRTIIADYFVLCTGSSTTQVSALSDEVEYRLSQYDIKPLHTENGEIHGFSPIMDLCFCMFLVRSSEIFINWKSCMMQAASRISAVCLPKTDWDIVIDR